MAGQGVEAGLYQRRDASGAEGLVRVSRALDGKVEFHPEGGGFLHVEREAGFVRAYRPVGADEVLRLHETYSRTWIRGDWFADEAEPMPAWGNGRLWNGFEMPMFERDAVLAAIADGRLSGAGLAGLHPLGDSNAFLLVEGDGGGLPAYDPDALGRLAADGATEATVGGGTVYLSLHRPIEIATPDGPVQAYDIGSGGWCWCAAEEPGLAVPRP